MGCVGVVRSQASSQGLHCGHSPCLVDGPLETQNQCYVPGPTARARGKSERENASLVLEGGVEVKISAYSPSALPFFSASASRGYCPGAQGLS